MPWGFRSWEKRKAAEGSLAPRRLHIGIGSGLSASNRLCAEDQALRFLTLFFLAAAFSEAGTTSITSTVPPAASTAWRAPADAPATRKASLDVMLPLPS